MESSSLVVPAGSRSRFCYTGLGFSFSAMTGSKLIIPRSFTEAGQNAYIRISCVTVCKESFPFDLEFDSEQDLYQ